MFLSPVLEAAHHRALKQRRRFIDWDEFMTAGGNYLRHYLLMGSDRNAFDACHRVSLCDHRHRPYPDTALIRPYMNELSRAQGGPQKRVPHDELQSRRTPAYFGGLVSGELATVDLDAAYWQIYTACTLDLSYDGIGTPINGNLRFLGADELRPLKHLRNAIVGAISAEHRTELDHGKALRVPVPVTIRRPDLWGFICDLLEAVAVDVRALFGAVHVMTDGYILPHGDLAEDCVDYLRTEWGLSASIRDRGEGIVAGLGNWQIWPDVENVRGPLTYPGESIDNLMFRHNADDLRQWFRDAAEWRDENLLDNSL